MTEIDALHVSVTPLDKLFRPFLVRGGRLDGALITPSHVDAESSRMGLVSPSLDAS